MKKVLVPNNAEEITSKYTVIINGSKPLFFADDDDLQRFLEEGNLDDIDTADIYTLESTLSTKEAEEEEVTEQDLDKALKQELANTLLQVVELLKK